ncbi:Cob(I)yrinic acid a,c-diamide adenosyltransferase [Alicyclobacillus contaminans]|nr:cob(I)yrinic acid a,c-diamide adenosyltransferase [Alicyclobacillus contaminans]GMA48776.1 Cob(I)yrinic acid a,c-diamide adenosyltransferase [Alicyclobacillus contaminans]
MRIYTRGGDEGKTGLIGGVRRFKDDLRVEAYGSVDEAGAFIGLAVSYLEADGHQDLVDVLLTVQQTLWDVGADLAAARTDRYQYRTPEDAAAQLEPWIDRYNQEAEAVQRFILRGGTLAASALHVACTVVRRAERRTVRLMQVESIHPPVLRYLNRLSDLLFVLARVANARAQRRDVEYVHSANVFRG